MPEKLPISLQMYTVRDEAAKDFVGTLARIKAVGFTGVELGGYGSGKEAAEVKKILADIGLIASGTMVGLEVIEQEINACIDYNLALGTPFLTVPYLQENRRQNLDDYRTLGSLLSDLGAKAKAAGVTLCYHHHDFEFNTFGTDTYGLDVLLGAADPDNLKVEVDTYWVKAGGAEPADYIRKHAGRVPLVHLKDRAADGKFAEVGEGTLDFAEIFEATKLGPAQFYIVEQDQCYGKSPLDCIATSFQNLQKMGAVL